MDRFRVVVNHEEQYSIWPADRASPRGWKDAGRAGTEQQCLEYIEEVWTDMRPLSATARKLKIETMKAKIAADASRH